MFIDDSSKINKIVVCLIANWAMVNSGMVLGFPSVMLPPLLGSNPGLHISVSQASWLSGLTFVSAPVTCLVTGPLIDSVGRRRGLLLLNMVFTAGWLLLATCRSVPGLCAGRMLSGVGLGAATCVTATYTAEVASDSIRTVLVTLSPVMMALGTFLAYLGALCYQKSWVEVALMGLGLSLLSLLLMPLLPESPQWLFIQGRANEAAHALQRLYRPALVSSGQTAVKHERSSWLCTLYNLKKPQVYKPLIIMNLFFILQAMSGVSIVIAYAVDFTRSVGVSAHAYHVALGIAFARMFSSLLTAWTCGRYGRRRPALLSSIIMTTSVLVLALFKSPWFLLPLPSLMAGFLLLLYVLSSSVGFSALLWSMLGEVFPTDVRGVASGMTACFVYLETFIVLKLYPCLAVSIGAFPILLFFGISGAAGTIFFYFFLPETHGKTLAEIEEYFKACPGRSDGLQNTSEAVLQ